MSPDGDITLPLTPQPPMSLHCCPAVSHCSRNSGSKPGNRHTAGCSSGRIRSSESGRKVTFSVQTAAEEFRQLWWGVCQCMGLLQEAGVLLLLSPWEEVVPASALGHWAGSEHPRIHSPAACKGLPSNDVFPAWVCEE